jgi:hypothetical protein
MTIKISELNSLTTVLGNVQIPLVANIAGTLTTVKGNVDQLTNYILGTSGVDYANIVANAGIQAGQIASLTSNAAVQSGLIADLDANAAVQSGLIAGLEANAATQAGVLTTLTSNAAVQSGLIADLTSNAAVQSGLITDLTSNAAVQSGLLAGLEANAAVQSGLITDLTSNAAVQAGAIANLTSNVSTQANLIANITSYSNSAVASYLPTYSGNIGLDRLLFTDLSEQTTAYTGQSWRTLLESTLTEKPNWLSYYPDGDKPTLDTNFGFDNNGMWFYGNATDQHAYPIRTNVNFHDTDVTEIITTINFGNANNDHGFAIFNAATTQPYWRDSTDATRIAFQLSVGTPQLFGITASDTGTSNLLTAGNSYTIRFVYDPANNVTVYIHDGTSVSDTLIETLTITEALPSGDYIIGFDADQDASGFKSYYTSLTIKTLANAVFNNVDIVNDLIVNRIGGNLIPSANVTYSLGSETAQWKDLYLSGSTIYIGGGNISVAGNTLTTSLPFTATGTIEADDLVVTNSIACGTIFAGQSELTGVTTLYQTGFDSNVANLAYGTVALSVTTNGDPRADEGALIFEGNNPDGVGIVPSNDNQYTLGAASHRWSTVHADTISTTTVNLPLNGTVTGVTFESIDYAILNGSNIGGAALTAGNSYVGVTQTFANVVIYNANTAVTHTWQFTQDGDIKLPSAGDILDSAGNSAITSFTMSNAAHWTTPVTTIAAALNQIAERLWDIENPV